MSSDLLQMRRSWMLVVDEVRRRHPRLKKEIALGTTNFTAWALRRAIALRRLWLIPLFGAFLVPRDADRAARILVEEPLRRLARRLRRPMPAELPRFIIGDPDLGA
jgi:hypothetical protein